MKHLRIGECILVWWIEYLLTIGHEVVAFGIIPERYLACVAATGVCMSFLLKLVWFLSAGSVCFNEGGSGELFGNNLAVVWGLICASPSAFFANWLWKYSVMSCLYSMVLSALCSPVIMWSWALLQSLCSFFEWAMLTSLSSGDATNSTGTRMFEMTSFKSSCSNLNPTLSAIELLINESIPSRRNVGREIFDYASSSARSFRLENGLSAITPAKSLSILAYSRAVTAPILLSKQVNHVMKQSDWVIR